MARWEAVKDENLFLAEEEQPGSQKAYERDTEIKRRLYTLQKNALNAQIDATAAQRDSIRSQDAAVAEMRRQSNMLLWSVVGVFLTAVVTLIAAFIN